jgi:hypothetical protein
MLEKREKEEFEADYAIWCKRFSTGECHGVRRYLYDLECEKEFMINSSEPERGIITEGYIEWKDDPHDWAGPFGNQHGQMFAKFFVQDSRIQSKLLKRGRLKSVIELFEESKRIAEHSMHNVPEVSLRRLGWDYYSSHWNRPFIDKDGKVVVNPNGETVICSYFGSATDEDLEAVLKVMTPLEKVWREVKIARRLGQVDPFVEPSLENPIKLFLHGNDDCSWTINFSMEDKEKLNRIFHLFRAPNWALLKDMAHFTN